MWRQLTFVLSLTLSTLAIRVPTNGNSTESTTTKTAEKKQDAFYVSDGDGIDSYLLPPDPHKPEDVLSDIATPATYLLPPSPEKQIDYYAPTEGGEQGGEQTDWYPIAQAQIPSTPVKLLPPSQSEAIPILVSDQQSFQVPEQNYRGGKAYGGGKNIFYLPSRQLEPPEENAPNDYTIEMPSEEQELPAEDINHQFHSPSNKNNQYNLQSEEINNQSNSPSSEEINHKYHTPAPADYEIYPKPIPKYVRKLKRKPKKSILGLDPIEPTLALHLTPPKPESSKNKVPTKLYPKKVNKGFHPVPIPIGQFAEDTADVPRAKPLKPLKPVPSDETEYITPLDEKRIYLLEQAQKKRLLKGEHAALQQQQLDSAAEDTYGDNAPAEPETSETNYRHPGHTVYGARPAYLHQALLRRPVHGHEDYNVYPIHVPLHQASAPLRQVPGLLSQGERLQHQAEKPLKAQNAPVQQEAPAPPPPKDRTEFRMHGMKGPHSYQFGYDTGKGKNRQFRYEERDNDGRVKGHYGYMDKNGKLRVVNYDADPEHGFHAEAPVDKE